VAYAQDARKCSPNVHRARLERTDVAGRGKFAVSILFPTAGRFRASCASWDIGAQAAPAGETSALRGAVDTVVELWGGPSWSPDGTNRVLRTGGISQRTRMDPVLHSAPRRAGPIWSPEGAGLPSFEAG
jgi:hypothetical protein